MKTRHSNTATTAILAISGTVGFYVVADVIPQVPGLADSGAFLQRYFCGHPLEYISTAMFFTGLAILVQKFWQLRIERAACTASQLMAGEASGAGHDSATEAELSEWCESHKEFGRAAVSVRMRDVLQYVHGSGRAGLEEHLRYLADLASERLQQSYATIRTITWAIPILGFLGTVIGITMAIANVTPEQLDTSLGEVTSGLSTAFDTTALALGMSIAMVFAAFSMERLEQNVLNDVEQFGIERLLPWFGVVSASEGSGALSASGSSSEILEFQQRLWSEQLAELKDTWSELLREHAGSVRQTLDGEVQNTLRLHRETSEEARDAYASALHQSSGVVMEQTQELLAKFEERIGTWQDALMTSSRDSVQQTEALHDLGATLLRMTESEERLVELQKLLNDNLQALRVADTMEQTASSLTAAVHVLTARTSPRRAA